MKVRRNLVNFRVGVAVVAIGTASLGALGVANSSGATKVTPHTTGHVLLVGTFKGHKGQYTSIQDAVNHAVTGDWIFVAPGDYHESADIKNPPSGANLREGGFAGVLVTTPGIHIRGMNRNTVIVDGTSSSATGSCSSKLSDQMLTTPGRNGIVVYRANNVSIENLKVCNFLSGGGDSGNGIWWNGGAGSGVIGLSKYSGAYLTATDTFFNGEQTAGTYGIFSSNAAGPATWTSIYASNQNDSGMYVGACLQRCNITINGAWMENNALGYSGTNSGGAIVIEHSTFDQNRDGLDTNTQIAGDPPAPQNGLCLNNAISPITHTHSCWVLINNTFTNNNNPNTPASGSAAAGPTGTGMTLSGGINDTVMNNTFSNNGAWGILFIPYPDSSTPSLGQTCAGTGGHQLAGLGCVYDPQNDALINNKFVHNGFFGNSSNGDVGLLTLSTGEKQNCFRGNTIPDGTTPSNLQTTQSTCGSTTHKATAPLNLFNQVLCDTGFGACGAGMVYPVTTTVALKPLPAARLLKTMANPCAGLPSNAWCINGRPI